MEHNTEVLRGTSATLARAQGVSADTGTHACTHTHLHIHSHTHAHTHTHTHTNAHTHAHTHTHTHAHAHTHVRTHTHHPPLPLPLLSQDRVCEGVMDDLQTQREQLQRTKDKVCWCRLMSVLCSLLLMANTLCSILSPAAAYR